MGSLTVIGAFLRRDWAVERSYRVAFVLDLLSSVGFLAIFYFLSPLVDDSKLGNSAQVSGSYFAFAVVGIIVFEVMQTGLTSFALRLRNDQTTGTLEALLMTPAPQLLIIGASAAYDLLRALAMGLVMLVLAALLGVDFHVTLTGLGTLLLAIPATIVLVAATGLAFAGSTIVFKQTASGLHLVTAGIAVLAGTYFPVSTLPAGLEAVARVLPFTWALDVLRPAALGGTIPADELVGLVLAAALAPFLAFFVFNASIRHAKAAGTLSQY